MTYSPSPNEFDDLFTNQSITVDDDVRDINPDEFLNLDEFREIKSEQHSPQQLTPPISPRPSSNIIIDSSIYQSVRIIPIAALQQRKINNSEPAPSKRIKLIVPKPSSSSSESDSSVNRKTVLPAAKQSNSPVDKALMKQQRLIKNREAANISRLRQKEYLQSLEAQNEELLKENSILKAENSQLRERISGYGAMTCRCASSITRKLPSKHATFLLAVFLMVGVNIFPFGSLIFSSGSKKPIEQQPFVSRHLLFAENLTMISNDSLSNDSLESDSPVYFNQTDHIRKVNIENIRRWIPEPDLFNVSSLRKSFDFNPDPLQEKLAKMYEKSREQSQKHTKTKRSQKNKKKPPIGPVLYNSNLNVIRLNEFFDEINRKDDTFYVFSFKADHLLLPPDNSYNFSQIKMNLIMPRNNGKVRTCSHITNAQPFFTDSLSSDKITMMQIETIIINTSLIQITEKSIPENFLKSTNNSTTCTESSLNLDMADKSKKNFNVTATTEMFQPLPLSKAAKFPSYFNTLDLLKANSKN